MSEKLANIDIELYKNLLYQQNILHLYTERAGLATCSKCVCVCGFLLKLCVLLTTFLNLIFRLTYDILQDLSS